MIFRWKRKPKREIRIFETHSWNGFLGTQEIGPWVEFELPPTVLGVEDTLTITWTVGNHLPFPVITDYFVMKNGEWGDWRWKD